MMQPIENQIRLKHTERANLICCFSDGNDANLTQSFTSSLVYHTDFVSLDCKKTIPLVVVSKFRLAKKCGANQQTLPDQCSKRRQMHIFVASAAHRYYQSSVNLLPQNSRDREKEKTRNSTS